MKPWIAAIFELLVHAEQLRVGGRDSDRRAAFIVYDSVIELSIATYLGLHPLQREGLELSRADTRQWLVNYFTKLEFLEYYVNSIRQEPMVVGRDEILYFHRIRNDLYHGSPAHVPGQNDQKGIRDAALWVFAVLFRIDPEPLILAACRRPR